MARSGWSKKGKFGHYLLDGTKDIAQWKLVKEAGRPSGTGPGTPNFCERVESRLFSHGGDSGAATKPFRVRLGKYIDLGVADDVAGIAALRRIHAAGPVRHQSGLVLDGDEPTELGFRWRAILAVGVKVGDTTNCV